MKHWRELGDEVRSAKRLLRAVAATLLTIVLLLGGMMMSTAVEN
jgi:hypothetical protein